jgi:hypothetical protein
MLYRASVGWMDGLVWFGLVGWFFVSVACIAHTQETSEMTLVLPTQLQVICLFGWSVSHSMFIVVIRHQSFNHWEWFL